MKKAIHPFLLGIFPILFLFSYNIADVPATDLILPIIVISAGTAALFLLSKLIAKSWAKAGIITSWFLLLFFSHGHIRTLLFPSKMDETGFGINLLLVSVWIILFAVGTFLIIKLHRNFSATTKFLNIVAVVLIAFSLVNISINSLRTTSIDDIYKESDVELSMPRNPPDIYYIILDKYTREDFLNEYLDYDNSGFINYLTSKGFYIATKSCSNYDLTYSSLASSLNMCYVDDLEDPERLKIIADNKVSRLLKSAGYRCIFVDGGTLWKGIDKHVDVYTCTEVLQIRLTGFAYSLCGTTLAAPIFRYFSNIWRGNTVLYGANVILYAFDILATIPNIEEPTFTYAHIFCPHEPARFDVDGPKSLILFGGDMDFYPEGYIGNLEFINRKVKTLIDEILSKSGTPPIIILQGDHGTWHFKEREYDILNAYHLPGKGNELLYETISPVNSFRVIFNLYFGTDYELLEDRSQEEL